MGAPSGYQTPKTNWAAGNVPAASDFNRIEGNIQAVEEGSRTIDPAQAPSSNSGTLRQLLDWFANRIKAILGTTNWYDTPPATLQDAKDHFNNTSNPHNVTAAQTGALVSIDGVSNAGGNVDLVAGANISITPDNTDKNITISGTGTWPNADTVDNIHFRIYNGVLQYDDGTGWKDVALLMTSKIATASTNSTTEVTIFDVSGPGEVDVLKVDNNTSNSRVTVKVYIDGSLFLSTTLDTGIYYLTAIGFNSTFATADLSFKNNFKVTAYMNSDQYTASFALGYSN